ncbi:hypothetical protein ABZ816_04520 [Actinosynnema sp. NPDC047251]|nr:hypothetical protein [Saccharothrix espanaensis]
MHPSEPKTPRDQQRRGRDEQRKRIRRRRCEHRAATRADRSTDTRP